MWGGVSETAWRSSGAVIRAEDAAESFPGLDVHDRLCLGFALDEAVALARRIEPRRRPVGVGGDRGSGVEGERLGSGIGAGPSAAVVTASGSLPNTYRQPRAFSDEPIITGLRGRARMCEGAARRAAPVARDK